MGASRLVISTLNNLNLGDEYDIITSVKGVNWANYKVVVFNSCIESDIESLQHLVSLENYLTVLNVYYIAETVSSMHYVLFRGLDADIVQTEGILSDSEALDFVCSSFKTHGCSTRGGMDAIETLKNGLESVLKRGVSVLWQSGMSNVVSSLEYELSWGNTALREAIDAVSSLTREMSTLQAEQANSIQRLHDLSMQLQSVEEKSKTAPNMVMHFANYTVPPRVPRVLYIRELSKCTFLFSFFHSYLHYLRISKGISAKILVLAPRTKCNITKYSNFSLLAQDTLSMVDFSSDVFVTFEPKKIVLDRFFTQGCAVYIILDYLGGDKLITGAHVVDFVAVNALSDVEKFKLTSGKESVINSGLATLRGMYTIPYIQGYLKANDVTRKSLYAERCQELYQRLNGALKGVL